jgi:hypothetical protein
MVPTQHNMEELKARIVEALMNDSFLFPLWSGQPECDVFPHDNSDYFKHVLVTVFLNERVLNRVNIGAVIKRIAELVRPLIQLADDICALAGWIGSGDSRERYFRVLRFCITKEGMENPLLDSLSRHFGEEYFNEEGISFLRYHPL